MPRYLISFKLNSATYPVDPKVAFKMTETNFALHEQLEKAGIIKETGSFNPGDGFMIAEFPSFEEAYKLAHRFWPHMTMNIREIISWEKNKEIVMSILREQAK